MRTVSILTTLLAAAVAFSCRATNYYVVASGSVPTPPYTNWGWAHTNLIEVVARARSGDTIYVTNNSSYYLTNRVYMYNKTITVRSWAPDGSLDPATTIIHGYQPATLDGGCFYMAFRSNTMLAGFTITNGYGNNGGAVQIAENGGTVSNCIIVGNVSTGKTSNTGGGGGIHIANGGQVKNCIIRGNSSAANGSAIMVVGVGSTGYGVLIQNCTISDNSGGQAAVYSYNTGTSALDIIRCDISGHFRGVFLAYAAAGKIRDCTIKSNNYGVLCYYNGNICNSLLAYNTNSAIVIKRNGTVVNCTVVSNGTVGSATPGIQYDPDGTVGYMGYVSNTISYFNNGEAGKSNWSISASSTCYFHNCCTAPTSGLYGADNICGDPRLASRDTGDFRLTSSSPCINAGANMAWMINANDLGGNKPRIDRFSGIVDIGAYEHLLQGSLFICR